MEQKGKGRINSAFPTWLLRWNAHPFLTSVLPCSGPQTWTEWTLTSLGLQVADDISWDFSASHKPISYNKSNIYLSVCLLLVLFLQRTPTNTRSQDTQDPSEADRWLSRKYNHYPAKWRPGSLGPRWEVQEQSWPEDKAAFSLMRTFSSWLLLVVFQPSLVSAPGADTLLCVPGISWIIFVRICHNVV